MVPEKDMRGSSIRVSVIGSITDISEIFKNWNTALED